MFLEYFPLGALGANCYVIGCEETKEAMVIDPGGNPRGIINLLDQKGYKLKYIVNTHGHIDHIAGNEGLREATGATLAIHKADAEMLTNPMLNLSQMMGKPVAHEPAELLLNEGDVLEVGNIKLKVIHTPGHTKGSICLLAENKLFAGDTLFEGSIGRTDFPGGSFEDLNNAVKTKLFTLPDNTHVYCGHGPITTIGYEKKSNPFIR